MIADFILDYIHMIAIKIHQQFTCLNTTYCLAFHFTQLIECKVIGILPWKENLGWVLSFYD